MTAITRCRIGGNMKITCYVHNMDQLKRKVAAYKELFATPRVEVSGTFEEPNGNTVWLTSGCYRVSDIGNRYMTINDGTAKPLRVRFAEEAAYRPVTLHLS